LVEQDKLQNSFYRFGITTKEHSVGKRKQAAKQRASGLETATT